MSFCCGASMVGAIGTMRHGNTYVHNLPMLVCPVCHQVEVHHAVMEEFDILMEYAESDAAREVDFAEYIDPSRMEEIFENCISCVSDDPQHILEVQIDMALDLLLVAKQLQDAEWEWILKKRLKVLSEKKQTMLSGFM